MIHRNIFVLLKLFWKYKKRLKSWIYFTFCFWTKFLLYLFLQDFSTSNSSVFCLTSQYSSNSISSPEMGSYSCCPGRILSEMHHNNKRQIPKFKAQGMALAKIIRCKERPYEKYSWLHVHIISLRNAPQKASYHLFQCIIWCVSLCCYTLKKYKILNYFFIFHFVPMFHNLSLSYYKALQET